MASKGEAEYKCLKCGFEFCGNPGPTICKACGYNYVKWINYETWRKINPTKYNPIKTEEIK